MSPKVAKKQSASTALAQEAKVTDQATSTPVSAQAEPTTPPTVPYPGGGNGTKPKPESILEKISEIDAPIVSSFKQNRVAPEHSGYLINVEEYLKPEVLNDYHSFLMGDPNMKNEFQPKDKFGRLLDSTGEAIRKFPREYHPEVWPDNYLKTPSDIQTAYKNEWRLCSRTENPEIRETVFDNDGKVPIAYGEYVLMWRPREIGRQRYEASHAKSKAIAEKLLGSDRADPDFAQRMADIKEANPAYGGDMTVDERSTVSTRA